MKSKKLFLINFLFACALFNGICAQENPTLDWSKFDFVSGDEIIFEDNLDGERNGEFPSKWDLVRGSVENAVLDGENVIMFINTNSNSDGGVVPMMTKGYEDYLPDEFTLEFDAYFDNHNRTYRILFYDGKNQRQLNRSINPGSNQRVDRIRITQNSVTFGDTYAYYPGFGESTSDDALRSKPGWRRVSISFNKRALKVYLDDARVLNIPNMNYNPIGLTFAYHNPTGGHLGYIKNIRIAKGAVPLYDKMLTDGKIITTGIRFDVNKSTLRPESFGVINEIVKLMDENLELNFSVEGHTDSDGSESHNQTLSESRAKAVMDQMIKMGISQVRLKSVGHGQSIPIAGNDTSEGKAQNRRVEFVKF
jgi:outer membrane protein OmpA-like peptidoglycan-associated protein